MHGFDPTKAGAGYEPYGSKMLFLLDWLNNMPCHRISSSLMKAILFVLREGGANNVPSFSHLQRTQVAIRETFAVDTLRFESQNGNIFFMNSIPQIIARVSHTIKSSPFLANRLIGLHESSYCIKDSALSRAAH
jgi:hypothetical protein